MIEWSQLPGFLKLLNPAALFRWFRRKLAPKEPPRPTVCRNCGRAGAMTLESSRVQDGHAVELWKCEGCDAPRHVVYPKP